MCGRYVLVQSIEVLEKRFNITLPIHFDWSPNYNISPGQYAPVITSANPKELTLLRFGLTPFWSKKKMLIFNARAEGERNESNDVNYSGSIDIINRPSFRKPIRSQRCLVIADAFIEGSLKDGLDNPYLVFLKNKQRPFCFAGIYDIWKDPETLEEVRGFSIITTVANELLQKIPHHRSPVILKPGYEQMWLNPNTPLSDITKLLKPFPSELMNAYPIDKEIKNPKNNDKALILPKGSTLFAEQVIKSSKDLKLQGMGSRKQYTEQNWNTKS